MHDWPSLEPSDQTVIVGGRVYRLGVCVCLFRDGFFLGQAPNGYTMIHGGVHEDESPHQAALRELGEELCVRRTKLIAAFDNLSVRYFPKQNELGGKIDICAAYLVEPKTEIDLKGSDPSGKRAFRGALWCDFAAIAPPSEIHMWRANRQEYARFAGAFDGLPEALGGLPPDCPLKERLDAARKFLKSRDHGKDPLSFSMPEKFPPVRPGCWWHPVPDTHALLEP